MAKLFDNGHALNLVENSARSTASPSMPSDTEHQYGALHVGEMKHRQSMDERHGLLHKKQPGATADLTNTVDLNAAIARRYPPSATAAPAEPAASIEVVPAEVSTGLDDTVATVVSVETVVFAEASAAVEAASAGPNNPPVPTVPSVPAFPTNLTVPAVPTATWESIPAVVDYPFPPSSAPESPTGSPTGSPTEAPTEPVAEQATPTATLQPSLAPLQPSSQLIIQSPPATPLPSETTFASSLDSSTTSAASTALSGSDPVVSAAARPTVSSALSQGGSLLSGSTPRMTATASVRSSPGSLSSGSANPTISVQAASASSGRSSLFTSAGTVYVVSVNANSRITQTLPASAIPSVSLSPSADPSSPTEIVSDSATTSADEASATDASGTASFMASDPAVATGTPVVGLPGAPGEPGAAPAATASASSSAESSNNSDSGESPAVPTRTVVGGVVGGIAGMAVLLLILLMILKWYRRRRGAPLRLPDHSTPSADPFSDDAHPMEERHRGSVLPVAAAGFMRKISGGTPPPSAAAPERGFQRISGRKLPSAHSPGMTSADVPAPLRSPAALSDSSFYRDSQGFYGGPGIAPAAAAAAAAAGPSRGVEEKDFEKAALDKETIMPSPARTPVVTPSAVQRSSSFLTQDTRSPPSSGPRSDGRPDTGLTVLSTVSQGGSRSSKFVEEDKWGL